VDSPARPEFDALVAELRRVGDRRMAERRQRRAQPAPSVVTPPPAPGAKAPPGTMVKALPAAAEVKARITQIAEKAATLKAPPEAAEIPAGDSAGDHRAQLRAQHAAVMQRALEALRAGRISAVQLSALQAARLRADAALDGHTDAAEELRALRLLDQKQGG
jgi:hypothetical protein